MESKTMAGPKPSILMEQHKHTFTKSEHKIYDYILSHPDKVLYHSLTELSEYSKVAEATVLRFFRKLGFKGFQDFKFLFAQEVPQANHAPQDESFVHRIRYNIVQAIEDSSEVVDLGTLEKCINAIDASQDVVIFGIGSSGIAGLDMQNRLMRIGKHVNAITDSHFQIMRASSLNENSVVIAISLTGSTKDIVDAVKLAKEKKATVIALTNYVKSPLTKYADHVLLSSAKESPLDSGSLVSKIAQLYLIDLICTGLTMNNVKDAESVKREITEHIAGKLY
ncbi:MurR/RpiR family transcriptional regulator [Microbacterium sp. APC 3898]|uniref:MurR/RpiR family transcriptional regulator n=1 Tax=Planococcus notacanthi TaxID=3035188 RepID=A0ABT7ZEY8_9BACL|nr:MULTISPECIES: MurR/RpiR family transcriptional regulator [Terrabacteria group]MBF6632531.1 MurR/RpiR family transcriptional regulator [Planococcus sp. (in: firmicutes)]MDN3425722.1 MurR/RpiR family transcriptional regulator [Planococcus sp. APC 4016]MDN3437310.1 MurR/RpiR family transcriptional regulator [Planococcus sp. APC 3900]MDN3500730.1 MurR/RpiR family transcriptional regulator [Microbacterium sp. APC 3898]